MIHERLISISNVALRHVMFIGVVQIQGHTVFFFCTIESPLHIIDKTFSVNYVLKHNAMVKLLCLDKGQLSRV